MSETRLVTYWADRLYETEAALTEQQPFLVLSRKDVYLAADVGQAVKDSREGLRQIVAISLLADNSPKQNAARECGAEAQRLLASLKGWP